MADIVRGEASESDEELILTNQEKIREVFASEVKGEASESDEDVYEKKPSLSASGEFGVGSVYENNLLQRKLIENNAAIWRELNNFVKNAVTAASKQLLSTDQLLIKSQVSMQSAQTSLKSSRCNIGQLHDKIKDTLTTSFIPNIRKPNMTQNNTS